MRNTRKLLNIKSDVSTLLWVKFYINKSCLWVLVECQHHNCSFAQNVTKNQFQENFLRRLKLSQKLSLIIIFNFSCANATLKSIHPKKVKSIYISNEWRTYFQLKKLLTFLIFNRNKPRLQFCQNFCISRY